MPFRLLRRGEKFAPPSIFSARALSFRIDCASVVQGERRGKLAWPLLSRRPHSPLHLNCSGKGTTIFLRCQISGFQLGRFSTPIDTILCRACSHSAKLKFIWLCPRLTATFERFSTDLFVILQHADCQVCTNRTNRTSEKETCWFRYY